VLLPASFIESIDLDARAVQARTSAESLASAPDLEIEDLDSVRERKLVDHYFERMDTGWPESDESSDEGGEQPRV
jgi:hypothetical protein